ncbi:MAG TPA: cytochrome c oxidase subunit II [Candidatus Polarisedimenticolia bacterium]|nr:cytochrome c oxidase subunit II [Candidatus Polarisedimenticolia bacterium]
MFGDLPLFPEQASTMAGRVDALYFYLLAVTGFFTLLIFTLLIVFAVRYRHRPEDPRTPALYANYTLEIVWSVIPLVIAMSMFVWGAKVYFDNVVAPPGATEIFVVGRQWMWKFQHLDGRREINELHVPVGRPVKLTMASEDVIHSLYVPAFRVKMDVLPGRYSTLWFEPTRPGSYHLFCAEYCGTKHAAMGGWVHVMEPVRYEQWLGGEAPGESLAATGRRVFERMGCVTCHSGTSGARGPDLKGLYGTQVILRTGEAATADDTYLRESILNPQARVVRGYEPLMPTYRGQINEEGLMQILAYIRSIGPGQDGEQSAAPAPPAP